MIFTTFTAGTVAKASEVNDNFTLVRPIYKNYNSATEVTESVSAWTDTTKTFTITHPANSILTSMTLQAQMKTNNSSATAAGRIHISGTTLGDIYTTFNYGVSYSSVNYNWISTLSTSYVTLRANDIFNLNLPDTSTTFTIQLTSNNDNTKTAYIQNVILNCLILPAETV